MAKSKILFECNACGHQAAKWLGQCPSCSEWHSLQKVEKQKERGARHKVDLSDHRQEVRAKRLDEFSFSEQDRTSTGIGELDRVLGGGLVPASLILLGGDPGIGKSTLMLQVAKESPDMDLLYVAGEESGAQIRQRANRIGIKKSNLKLLDLTDLDRVIDQVKREQPELLVIDSIQTVYRSELSSLPGSTQQLRECAAILQQLAKREGITTLMIGHVTKEGEIAGPRILEHMVDTVLYFEGDQNRFHRLLRSVKNRFGPAQEVGVFEMGPDGLSEVDNPSALFLSDMDDLVTGHAVTCVMEGTRPLLVEVQALVTSSQYGTPQRTAAGFDQRRLSLLLAVLEKRAGMSFSSHDVYLNIAGGLRVSDTAADLAILSALASSYKDRPIRDGMVIAGEVGLGGEIRRVPMIGARLGEASKMGFRSALVPKGSAIDGVNGIEPIECRYIYQATDLLLGTEA
jgi:DNA repair protein RadA/Sms